MLGQIGPRVKAVFTEEGFTFSHGILVEDDVRLLIDTGEGKALQEINPQSIDVVLNSHHHIDHIRGNDVCSRARVFIHPLEKPYLQSPETTIAVTGWSELMDETAPDDSPQKGISAENVLKVWNVDGDLCDNQVIDCGHTRIQVLHTPGHCAGHCSFLFPEESMVFLGDICLSKVGPWYGEPEASIEDFIRSIDRVIDLKPERLTTGHVPQVISGNVAEVLTEYRDRIFKREQRILKALKARPATINDLAAQHLIYLLHPSTFVLFWEKFMLKKHLESLIAIGCVEKLEDERFRFLQRV